jgi:hypothetical protein
VDTITVTSQKEWDAIPKEFSGYVYIKSPNEWIVVAERKCFRVVARENSSVVAWENSSVVALENSSVVARENSSVAAWENSSVVARGNSSVVARENSSVVAWENSRVVARGNSSVEARENSSVVARENSSVAAWENSSVVARGNSSVVARGNSSVVAWENSRVVALENSSVVAWENVQIAQHSDLAKLKAHGNARIVYLPKTPQEYCDFYGITTKDGAAILYKAVREDLASFHDSNFKYAIGETITHECDPSLDRDCSFGLHVSHLYWALDFYRSRNNFKIIECAVPLDKIIVPKNTDGKVRTSELTVLREVPPEEWGVYGKILAKSKASKVTP